MSNGICHFDITDMNKRRGELKSLVSPTNERFHLKIEGGGDVKSKLI